MYGRQTDAAGNGIRVERNTARQHAADNSSSGSVRGALNMAYSSGRMDKINYQTPVMELAKFIEMIGGGAVGGLASCGAGRR